MPNPLNSLLNSKVGKIATNPYAASGAAAIATVSNLTKDAVNCYYYVTQSLHNEEIPEEKRKFVAGLDLSNGILNVLVQTGASIVLNKYIGGYFDKHIASKHFTMDRYKEMYKTMSNKIPFDNFVSNMESCKGFAKIGLSVISTLVAMQVIAKRIIVPLVATPLASVFKEKFKNLEKKCIDKTKEIHSAIYNFMANQKIKEKNTPECFKKFVNNHNNDKISKDTTNNISNQTK